jgi:phosphoribosyl-AMP cyclohydrolase
MRLFKLRLQFAFYFFRSKRKTWLEEQSSGKVIDEKKTGCASDRKLAAKLIDC